MHTLNWKISMKNSDREALVPSKKPYRWKVLYFGKTFEVGQLQIQKILNFEMSENKNQKIVNFSIFKIMT